MRRNGSAFQLHVDHWGGQHGTHARARAVLRLDQGLRRLHRLRALHEHERRRRRAAGGAGQAAGRSIARRGKDAWSSNPRSDSIEALVPAAGVDVFVFAGPTPLDAVRRYNLFGGGGALPPKWGLGFMTRTPTAYTAAAGAQRGRRVPQARHPARHARPRARLARPRVSVLVRVGPARAFRIPKGFLAGARTRSTCA